MVLHVVHVSILCDDSLYWFLRTLCFWHNFLSGSTVYYSVLAPSNLDSYPNVLLRGSVTAHTTVPLFNRKLCIRTSCPISVLTTA